MPKCSNDEKSILGFSSPLTEILRKLFAEEVKTEKVQTLGALIALKSSRSSRSDQCSTQPKHKYSLSLFISHIATNLFKTRFHIATNLFKTRLYLIY